MRDISDCDDEMDPASGPSGGGLIEQMSRFMLDSIAEAVVGLTLTGQVTYWNAAAHRCFGWSAEEAVGAQIEELAARDLSDDDAMAIFECLVAGQTWRGERMLVRRDGTRFPAEIVQSGVYSAGGELLGVIGVTTDLTKVKQAEDDVRRANSERLAAVERQSRDNARWRAILLQSADGAIIADPKSHTIMFASPAVTRLFGWTNEQLVGQPSAKLVHSEDLADLIAVMRLLQRDSSAHPVVEFRLLCADGSYRWVESTISRPSLDGVELGLVGNLRDVTQRRHTQTELQQRQELMVALAAKASEIALVVGSDGCVRYANRSVSPLVVGAEGDNWGRNNFAHVHKEDRTRFDAAMKGLREPGSLATIVYRRRDTTGAWRWVEQTVRNELSDPHIQGMVVNIRDIHERVEMEQALRQSEALHRMIAETAQEGIVVCDTTGRIVFANQMMETIYGIPLAELYSMGVKDVYPLHQHAEVDRLRDLLHQTGSCQFDIPFQRRDGSARTLRISASRMLDDTGLFGALSMVTDVTDAVSAERNLQFRAFHDPLTGLANRSVLVDRLNKQPPTVATGNDVHLANFAGGAGTVAVLLADIDQFKLVNDSLGHAAGDELLVAVAERWRQLLRPTDLLARIGGDEFVLVCDNCGEQDAALIASRLHEALGATTIEIAGRRMTVRASIGLAVRQPADRLSADTLLGQADAAMYEAKRRGRGRTAIFTADLIERAETRLRLTNDLKHAIDTGQLQLHYQPIIQLSTGKLQGIEALCRWTHEQRGTVPPEEFIRVAEDSGLIEQLDRWVLGQACRDAAALRAAGILPAGSYLTVNCSAHTLTQPDLEHSVRQALSAAKLPAETLVLEITESTVMRDPDAAQRILQRLLALGVRAAIDDFGTGHSSLAYLRRFPITMLKIDRSFISCATTSQDDRFILTTIIDLAHALGITTVCEGVETQAELTLLTHAQCDSGQGWFWSKALPAAQLCHFLEKPPPSLHAPSTLPTAAAILPRTPVPPPRPTASRLPAGSFSADPPLCDQ